MEELLVKARNILREIKYPGSPKDIISLDMIKDMSIDGQKMRLKIVFKSSKDPFVKVVENKVEKLLKEKAGYQDVEIEIIFSDELENPVSLIDVDNIIAISSGKGGVGKSTISSNLAVSLANMGYSVGLVDADIYGPSIPKMFGCEDAKPLLDEQNMIEPIEKYGVKLLSMGFFVSPGNATVWRGPIASNALRQMLEQGKWGALDYLLIDLPPGTSDIHLTLVQTLALTGAIVVSTPQNVALADAVKGINMFTSEGIDVPILGLVENMSWFTPKELPNNKYYIFGKDGCKKLAEDMEISLLGQIPLVQGIRECGDGGEPYTNNTDTITSLAFMDLASSLIKSVEECNRKTKKVRIVR